MTLLAALAARYDRMAAEGAAPVAGFAPAKIHYTIVLSPAGEVMAVQSEPRDGKGRILKEVMAPQAPASRRGEKIVAGSFWDPVEYSLGVAVIDADASEAVRAKSIRKAEEKHTAFKEKHRQLLQNSNDRSCRALLNFLDQWHPEKLDLFLQKENYKGSNFAFRLEGEKFFVHDTPAAREVLQIEAASAATLLGTCLISGQIRPIARLHQPIKGIGEKLAPLVSFNEDAFESFGREQGLNAPVSEQVSFAYTTALNELIAAQTGRDDKGRPLWANRIGLGEDTVVFWADTPLAEKIVLNLFDPQPPSELAETKKVRDVLQRMERGEPINAATLETDPRTKVYILGLSPNAARLSVRFWREGELGELALRFQEHWQDMRIEPAPRQRVAPVWSLLYELAPLRKIDKGLVHLAGELTRAIITGADYPGSLLAQALMRMRAEHDASSLRVALIKAVLTRKERKAWEEARRADPTRPEWKDRWMSLNRDEPNEGYRLGRLFAVLEAAQYAGLGRRVNAGVKDKFFGSASATPRHVFPSLLRGVQDHLSAARKKHRYQQANHLEKEMRDILNGFPSPGIFPAILTPEDQGAFVVGFYHQDAELEIVRAKAKVIDDPEDADTMDEEAQS